MALLYSKKTKDCHYQVRNAGNSIRLYSNGVLHSQYNSTKPINGAIWDLLLLPAFLLNTSPKNILLLGLGGGTLVHLIRRFFPETNITCVELDKQHIHIAKKWFGLPKKNVTVIQGDAYDYLRKAKKEKQKFDWIVDDVFQHVNGEPERGTDIQSLLPLYKACLSNKSLLTLNVIGKSQRRQFNEIKDQFSSVYELRHSLYENEILNVLKGQVDTVSKTQFKQRLAQFKELNQDYRTCKLNYGFRKIKCR